MPTGPMNLSEEQFYAGLWWLPTAPDIKIPGTLHYDPQNGLELVLIGAFEDRVSSKPFPGIEMFHTGSLSWELIHGVAKNRRITLVQCHPVGSSRTIGAEVSSPDEQTVVADSALFGLHLFDGESPEFASVSVSIENLGVWAASSGIHAQIGVQGGQLNGGGSISFTSEASKSASLDDAQINLASRLKIHPSDSRRGELSARVSEQKFLEYYSSEPISVDDATQFVRCMQDLITVATYRTTGVIWMRLGTIIPGSDLGSPSRSIDVLFTPSRVGESTAKAIPPRKMFFTCNDIAFEEIIPRWVRIHSQLRPALNMLLGLRYAPATYIENNLLTAVGAAEVLHKRLQTDVERTREAKGGSVSFSQNPEQPKAKTLSLRERLVDLAKRLDSEVYSLLMPDTARWAHATVRARNNLTHDGQTLEHSIEDLVAVVKVTTAVVYLNLLREVGLDSSQLRDLVRNHPGFSSVYELASNLSRSTQ